MKFQSNSALENERQSAGKVTIGTYKEVKKQEDGWFPKAAIGNKII